MAVLISFIDSFKSVWNRCVIEGFDGIIVLLLCIFDISVGMRVFVIELTKV